MDSNSDTDGGAAAGAVRLAMISVADGGDRTSPPAAVPDTITLLSDVLRGSSTAVNVTVPVLVVRPAAMTSRLPLSRKSPPTAGGTAAAETVIVAAALAVRSRIAVTVDRPPVSGTDPGDSDSRARGAGTTRTHSEYSNFP